MTSFSLAQHFTVYLKLISKEYYPHDGHPEEHVAAVCPSWRQGYSRLAWNFSELMGITLDFAMAANHHSMGIQTREILLILLLGFWACPLCPNCLTKLGLVISFFVVNLWEVTEYKQQFQNAPLCDISNSSFRKALICCSFFIWEKLDNNT